MNIIKILIDPDEELRRFMGTDFIWSDIYQLGLKTIFQETAGLFK